jgi:glutathione-specific gamma-glutamylcyclotransferase
MASNWIYYFGYGSLVNRDTRPAAEVAQTAQLWGWRRVWEHRATDPNRDQRCTSLSIEPLDARDDGCIHGVLVKIPLADLAQLDEREAGYERLTLSVEDFDVPDGFDGESISVYRSLPENRQLADAEHPVLQRYVDCVMAGYHRRFGDAGLQALIDTTRGWERTRLNDRERPFYPRSVIVDQVTRQMFDTYLEQTICR